MKRFAAGLLAAACGPIVAEAPFPQRPDTVEPADLLGPYDGQVIDGDSGHPVEGAAVVGAWGFSRGVGLNVPAGTAVFSTKTDADGHYRIERLTRLPEGTAAGGASLREWPDGLSAQVASFTLVVYARGYRGWRSDRELGDEGPPRPRTHFSQRLHRVELRHPRPGESRRRDLEYLGVWGDLGTIDEAIASEIDAAANERAQGATQ